MKKPSRREIALLAVLALAAAALAYWLLRPPSETPAARARAAQASASAVPRIDLARLAAPHDNGQAGRRNLFEFGAQPVAPRPNVVVPTPPPVSASPPAGTADGSAGAPSLPPLNVRYIGSVENSKGVKVAVLVTDRQEVLTGQAGQVVANRYRIARIGLESLDLEDIGTGQSRRLPMRGGT